MTNVQSFKQAINVIPNLSPTLNLVSLAALQTQTAHWPLPAHSTTRIIINAQKVLACLRVATQTVSAKRLKAIASYASTHSILGKKAVTKPARVQTIVAIPMRVLPTIQTITNVRTSYVSIRDASVTPSVLRPSNQWFVWNHDPRQATQHQSTQGDCSCLLNPNIRQTTAKRTFGT